MIKNIVLSLVCLATLTQPVEVSPLLFEDAQEFREDLVGRPGAAAATSRYFWQNASAIAAIPLFRAYINERVVIGDVIGGSDAQRWWAATLRSDPSTLATAISEADAQFVVWMVDFWPPEQADFLPAYRLALAEAVFAVYVANERKERELAAEVASFGPVDRLPPEGLPAGAAPSMVKDPALRKEYEGRLRELFRRQMVEAELHRTRNAFGQLARHWTEEFQSLYADASPAELRKLADMIEHREWVNSDLYLAIIKDWPRLAELVAELQSDEDPD